MTQPPTSADQRAAETAAIAAAFQRASAQLRSNVDAYVTQFWRSLGSYRTAQLRAWLQDIVPTVTGAMNQMQALTSAYLAVVDETHGGQGLPTPTVDLTTRDVRATDADTVYSRPFETVWRSLHDAEVAAERDGLARPADGWIDRAIREGLAQARTLAATDVQLAKTHTAQLTIARRPEIQGYRRQLEGVESCGLCVAASERVYRKKDLLPLHPNCDCTPVPVYTGTPDAPDVPAPVLRAGRTDLQDRAGAGTPVTGSAVTVAHHDELGPVLVVADQHFSAA